MGDSILSKGEDDPSLAWASDGTIYDKGPDQILPSSALHTSHPAGAVRLKLEGRGRGHDPTEHIPLSVPTFLKNTVERSPQKTALSVKRDGEWQKWTYAEYLRDVRRAAKAFIALGLERYHSVCILGFNSPEWFISNMGAIFAGGFGVGIYTSNSAEACAHTALDCEADVFVVEDAEQLQKILTVRHKLPRLKAIVQYSGEVAGDGVLSWSQFILLGDQESDLLLEDRLRRIAVNHCCTLIYTSGTTGDPKGVMLSHDNLTWTACATARTFGLRHADDTFQERFISFLPLSHIAAQLEDMYIILAASGQVLFANKDALRGSLVESLKEILPTKLIFVPRVLEKIEEKMREIGKGTSGLKRVVATWAKEKALEYNMGKVDGGSPTPSIQFRVADYLILSKVREALGLSHSDLLLSAGAPISTETLKYFMSLNILVTEVFGLSECCGPHTLSSPGAFRLGSVGKTMAGCDTKIHQPDREGSGEILLWGRHVTMGYLHQPQLTKEAIDSQGWFYSGDMGRLDKEGYLWVSGRLKEILVTAGGENMAPVPIEDRLKRELPLVSQAVLLGDRLKFISVLLTLKTEVEEPLGRLTASSKAWIETEGNCQVNTVQDVLRELYETQNEKLRNAFEAGVSRANKLAVSQAQVIKKWVVLPKDFSIPGGELGPTLKLKRREIVEKYKETISQIYLPVASHKT